MPSTQLDAVISLALKLLIVKWDEQRRKRAITNHGYDKRKHREGRKSGTLKGRVTHPAEEVRGDSYRRGRLSRQVDRNICRGRCPRQKEQPVWKRETGE